MNFGRCSICTISFNLNDIASLTCGHTFHNECIDRWIMNSRTCPNCRTTNTKRDITRLYFDEMDHSFSQNSDDQFLQNQAELLATIKKEKDANAVLKLDLQEYKEKVASLDRQLEREKIKAAQLNGKDQHIRELESQLSDQVVLKGVIEKYKRRLGACEFYNLLMKHTHDDNTIDKYLNKNGNPDEAKFLKQMRSQRDEEVKKNKKLGQDLAREHQITCNKEKMINNLKKEIESLRMELEGSKKRKVDETNGIVSPVKNRHSFGFSFTQPNDRGEIVVAAKNFAFEGDSSIEIVLDTNQPTTSNAEPLLGQFDPIVNKKTKPYANNKTGTKQYLSDDLAELFSPNLLSHAKKANL